VSSAKIKAPGDKAGCESIRSGFNPKNYLLVLLVFAVFAGFALALAVFAVLLVVVLDAVDVLPFAAVLVVVVVVVVVVDELVFAVFVVTLVLARLALEFEAVLVLAASPQAIPRALRPRTAERTTFFIFGKFSCLL
jgi:hypothetical protein